MKILVTGAAGLVGRHLLTVLRQEYDVYAMVRSGAMSGRVILQDIGQSLEHSQLPPQLDVIIHCAGIVGATNQPEEQYLEINVKGTQRLLEYGTAAGVGRFVFLSTGGVYAPTTKLLTESSVIQPQGKYAVSKWNAERVCQQYADSRLKITVLRLFFPYGPGQVGRLMPGLRDQIVENKPVYLNRNGEGPYLNPVYIDDLVLAIRGAMIAVDHDYSVYNIGGVEAVSMRALSEKIGAIVGRSPWFKKAPQSKAGNWLGSTDKLSREIGWKPETPLDIGLACLSGDWSGV